MAVHLGSLPLAEASSSSPWIIALAEAAAISPAGPLPGRSLSDCPWIAALTEVSAVFRWITVWIEILPALLRKDVLAEASSSVLLDSIPGRGRFRAPGAPFGPKPWRLSRIPAWAGALAVHRSVFRFRPKPWRFTCPESPCRPKPIGVFRPARMSAETGTLSGWLPDKAEALAVRLRSAVPAEADRSLRGGSPSGPKPFRFTFGGSVKPKLLVPPGCSTKLAGPCKSEGQARCVRMAAASSAALAVTSQIFACGPIRKRFRPQPGHSSRGAIDPATTGTCHGKPSRQSRICLWITRITGVESVALVLCDCAARRPLLWASAFLSAGFQHDVANCLPVTLAARAPPA